MKMTKQLAVTAWAVLLLASRPAQGQVTTFASAEAASQALVQAVQGNNEAALQQILGSSEALLQSDDDAMELGDRREFIEKYNEMHRLVRESDGSIVLYVGAENW